MLTIPTDSKEKRRSLRVYPAATDKAEVSIVCPAPNKGTSVMSVCSINLTGLGLCPAAVDRSWLQALHMNAPLEGELRLGGSRIDIRGRMRRADEIIGIEFADLTHPSALSHLIHQFMAPPHFRGIFRRMDLGEGRHTICWFRGARDFDVLIREDAESFEEVTVHLDTRYLHHEASGRLHTGRRQEARQSVLGLANGRARLVEDASPQLQLCKELLEKLRGSQGLPAQVVAVLTQELGKLV